jgi:hypothetical protein
MGRTTTYIRRKRNSKCFNPQEWDKISSIEICPCTEENYECDTGFFRDENGACLAIDEQPISYDPPDNCNGQYKITQGYRKVAGDSCFGGVSHDPI